MTGQVLEQAGTLPVSVFFYGRSPGNGGKKFAFSSLSVPAGRSAFPSGRPERRGMRFIDLFAGIGGFRRGMELAGHECVGFCEYDDFATASYTSMYLITEKQREYLRNMDKRKRQKEILKGEYKNGEWYAKDIKEVTGNNMSEAECWCFGAPCQSFSIAGKRAGLDGESGLVREVFRLLWEKREEDRPEWIIYENVKGMFSSNRGFDYLAILSEMDKLGYDVEWQLFNSKHWGVPQNRERVYTCGHLRRCGGREIFPFEGADGADRVSVRQVGKRPSKNRDNPQSYRVYEESGIAPCLNSMEGGGLEPSITVPLVSAPDSGTSARIDVVCSKKPPEANRFGQRDDVWGAKGISGCLTATEYKDPHRVAVPMAGMDAGTVQTHGGVYLPGRIDAVGVIPSTTGKVFKQRHTIWGARGISGNILASEGQGTRKVAIPIKNGTKQGYMMAHEGDSINYSFMSSKNRRGRVGVKEAHTLDTACNQGIFVQVTEELCVYAIWYERYQSYIAIRKLTPKECFRLQGWSWKCEDDRYFDRAEFVNSDSQLYKQAGNGVTVPVVEAIAERLS